MESLKEHGLWKFRTKNFTVVVHKNDDVYRSTVYCRRVPVARAYSRTPRLGVLRAVAQTRKSICEARLIKINQR